MEFRHLRHFVVLAEELHFGRAAQRLAMTQPPLSLSLQQLEARIGARLFDRDSKGVRLTAAGQALLPAARSLLAQAQEAQALARDVGAGAVGRLRVGLVGSMLYRGLPQWMQAFEAEHPRLELSLVEMNSQEQLEALLRRELDVGFVHGRRVPDALCAARVDATPFVACVGESHALAGRRSVPLSALRDEAFVLFSRHVSPDYHAQIVELCVQAGFYPRVRHELRDWLSVVALVAQGLGVALVPAPLQRSGMAGARFVRLTGVSAVSELHCVWHPDDDRPALQAWLRRVPGTSTAQKQNPPQGREKQNPPQGRVSGKQRGRQRPARQLT